MLPSSLPHSGSKWTGLLALCLGGILLVQAAPVKSVLQFVQHAECQCAHVGVCPRNPEGPCPCDHSSSADPTAATDAPTDGRPIVQECDGPSSNALGVMSTIKALFTPTLERPAPFLRPTDSSSASEDLSSQRVGDDVFHPPRATAAVRLG